MQSDTLIEGKYCWVADAPATRFGSNFGILASASRAISCLTYSKNIIAMMSAAALDLVWRSSGGWGKFWTTGLMCAPSPGRAPAFPLRFRGGEPTSAYLNQYQRLILMVSRSAALSLSSKTRHPYGLRSAGC